MPVAHNQLDEVYNIFRKYMSQTELREALLECQSTKAYEKNPSFAETIDRLLAMLKKAKL